MGNIFLHLTQLLTMVGESTNKTLILWVESTNKKLILWVGVNKFIVKIFDFSTNFSHLNGKISTLGWVVKKK